VQSALEPDWMYLIAAPEEIRGFTIRAGTVEEVELD
jgi:hypothetical protein